MEDRTIQMLSESSYNSKILLSNKTPSAYTEASTPLSAATVGNDGSASSSNYLPWDNPGNIISYETYLLLDRSLFCYVVPALFLIGVPTNFLNCVVFYKQGLRDRMNLCLFCLALVDMMFVALFFTLSFHCMLGKVDVEVVDWWKWIVRKYVTGLYRGFLFSSGSLTMIISVERCFCVFLPMKAATLMKTRTMAGLITATVLTLQTLCLLYPLKLDVIRLQNARTNTTTFFLRSTQLYRDNPVPFDILENIIVMTVIPFFTFFAVVVATALTVIQLKRAMAWRTGASANADTRKEHRLVVMLVTVSCLFIVTASPNIALGLARSLVHNFWFTRRYANFFLATHAWYLGLGALNSSVNFFIYVLRSSRFRQELRELFPLLGLCLPAKKRKSTDSCSSVDTTKGRSTETSAN